MVRETRFSVDADVAFELPGWRDALWDLEDLDLAPPAAEHRERPRGRTRQTSTASASEPSPRRHLAHADWLGETLPVTPRKTRARQ